MNEIETVNTRSDERSIRLVYMDNLKIFLTILVIVHHVGQAYGPGGFWHYRSSLDEQAEWLGSFFTVNAAFFMGLFFMISGYFIRGSYARNSGWQYIKTKLIRYGVPVVFSLIIMQPILMYFYYINYSQNIPMGFLEYYKNIYFGVGGMPENFIQSIGFPEMNMGHLWFVEILLIFSLLYYVFRKIFSSTQKNNIIVKGQSFKFINIIIIALLISISTGIIRIWFPIDSWIGLFGFIQMEPAHFPQYLIFFIVGIIAVKKDWLKKVTRKQGYLSLGLGIIMAVLVYCLHLMPKTLGKLVYISWFAYESFMAVFISFGLLVLFREVFAVTNSLTKIMSSCAYLVYILHYPIAIAVQYLLDKFIIVNATGKFITVSVITIAVTFLISYILRMIKPLRKVI
jgi:fucose 4-O-acetylase-like acetyltransferase